MTSDSPPKKETTSSQTECVDFHFMKRTCIVDIRRTLELKPRRKAFAPRELVVSYLELFWHTTGRGRSRAYSRPIFHSILPFPFSRTKHTHIYLCNFCFFFSDGRRIFSFFANLCGSITSNERASMGMRMRLRIVLNVVEGELYCDDWW